MLAGTKYCETDLNTAGRSACITCGQCHIYWVWKITAVRWQKKQWGESPETPWNDSVTISHKTISLQHCVLLGISTDLFWCSSFLPANLASEHHLVDWKDTLFYYSTSHKRWFVFCTSNKNLEKRFSEKYAYAFLTVLNWYNIPKQNIAILCHSVFSLPC